jgi:tRNA(Ile)-lysidine synthase
MPSVVFSPEHLLHALSRLPGAERYWVAYSGGMDSTVLLHALNALRDALSADLGALHVDHGLSSAAGAWRCHCRDTCARLGLEFRDLRVDAVPGPGESPEAAARHARYRALAKQIGPGEALVTAHHRDDQAETLLLQLLRGAGPRGLSAMPAHAPFAGGFLLRPLLTYPRSALEAYAEQGGLEWIQDQSNFDVGFDRNFLRHRVVPLLRQRWPSLDRTLARAAEHQAEAARLNDELAVLDARSALGPARGSQRTLRTSVLQELGAARARNLLRHWLRQEGLFLPSARVLQRILDELLTTRVDAVPLVAWQGGEVRRWRGLLYADLPRSGPAADSRAAAAWDLSGALEFAGGVLTASRRRGVGITTALCRNGVEVRVRRGGERCRPPGREHSRPLKKLLQEQGIPPWQRGNLPLIFIAGQLAAVIGLGVCEGFRAGPEEEGVEVAWQSML